MNSETKIIAGVLIGLVLCCCVLAVVMVALGGFLVFETGRTVSTEFGSIMTEIVATPVAFDTATPRPKKTPTATLEGGITRTPTPTPLPVSTDTLNALEEAVIPPSDLREVAMRLLGIPDIPPTVSDTPADHPVGTELDFFVTDSETTETNTVRAQLIYKTENVYFFADTGVDVNQNDVETLVDIFQNEIYLTNREFFGGEWNPGVDGDPRLYILYTRGLGAGAFTITVGYFSSADEYSRLANEYSNEKEMFYLNADYSDIGDPTWLGTLAHEFQHMIHWAHDRNEETWMNEGMSDLAEPLNGYAVGGHDDEFVADPDLQLNTWTEGGPNDNTLPHYGAAYMYMAYFLDRFGEDATKALVATDTNGMWAVEETLAAKGFTDPLTGQPLTAADVFADWVVANYLNDERVGDGRYAYHNVRVPRISGPTEAYGNCPVDESASVHQFAADYIELRCTGNLTINFTGAREVAVVPEQAHSGRFALWSHRNDESATNATREFDLTGLSSATLTYWAWWAIEEDYDYAYVEASTDGGETWTILETPGGTDRDPTGNNFGWGYTGDSEWTQERLDLTPYAGQKVLVRFEYITDPAVNRAGLLIDDIAVPELNYSEDFESDEGGWQTQGFVRMDNVLPQTFVVQVIRGQGAKATVERFPLDANNIGTLTVDLSGGESVTLVVSGLTPFTTQMAEYQIEVR